MILAETRTPTKVGRLQTSSKRPSIETLDITVLAGGPGVERAVSLESGQAVFDALERLGHRVELHDIDPCSLSALDRPADFVFITLHGEFGEDGAVQAALDKRGVPYCGSGAAASRLAMDKAATKRRFEQVGVPTPAYQVVDFDTLAAFASGWSSSAVVKPVASGSSVDTSIVHDERDLRDAAAGLVETYGQALVERYVEGPELTVGILGDVALPVCEIQTKRAFYDYQAKYEDDDTAYLFDVDLPSALLERVRSLSLGAHRALGCHAFSRIDWMIDAATMQPYALEINTIPGFTNHSLLPKAARRVGISFDDLCQMIIRLSLAERSACDSGA